MRFRTDNRMHQPNLALAIGYVLENKVTSEYQVFSPFCLLVDLTNLALKPYAPAS